MIYKVIAACEPDYLGLLNGQSVQDTNNSPTRLGYGVEDIV